MKARIIREPRCALLWHIDESYPNYAAIARAARRYDVKLRPVADGDLGGIVGDLCAGRPAPAFAPRIAVPDRPAIIVSGLHNNFVIEDLLRDMSARCGIDDINSFAETFAVCNRLGGNLKKVVVDSRDIISDKIEIEMEIQTTVAANKNEINIMCVMPFVSIAMMGTMGQASITANTPLNVLVKLIAIFMFVIAYKLGRKITDIKV